MEFFKIKKDIPFMRHALAFNLISGVTFLLAVFFLISRGLNFGVDFTGGTVMVSRSMVNLIYGSRRKLEKIPIGNTAWKETSTSTG